MSGSPATYLIRIRYDSEQKYESVPHVVMPPHQYLKRGDSVVFEAMNTDVIIFIPRADLLFGYTEKYYTFTIPDGKYSEQFAISMDCPVNREFPYTVYCAEGNGLAEGGSPPKMIIE